MFTLNIIATLANNKYEVTVLIMVPNVSNLFFRKYENFIRLVTIINSERNGELTSYLECFRCDLKTIKC